MSPRKQEKDLERSHGNQRLSGKQVLREEKFDVIVESLELNFKQAPRLIFKLLVRSWPNITSFLSILIFLLCNIISLKFTGNTMIIAGFGIGSFWFNSTGFILVISFCSGLVSMISVPFGAQNYKKVTQLYQKAIAIGMALVVLCSILIFNTERVLVLFGIDEQLARMSQEYCIWAYPSLFFSVFFETYFKLCIGQKDFKQPTKALFIAYILHGLWCYIFINYFDLGLIGCGISRNISVFLTFFCLYYQMKNDQKFDQTLKQFKFQYMFKGWWKFLKTAVPMGLGMLLEWVSFEIINVLIAKLNNPYEISGNSAFLAMLPFFNMFGVGISLSISSEIGNAIGESRYVLAKQLINLGFVAIISISIFLFLLALVCQPLFSHLLTTDDAMRENFLIAYRIFTRYYIFAQSLRFVLDAILKVLNQQNLVANLNLFSYIAIAIPLAYYMAFDLGYRLHGIWTGLTIASYLTVIYMLFVLQQMDFIKEFKIIHKLNKLKPKEIPLNQFNHNQQQRKS